MPVLLLLAVAVPMPVRVDEDVQVGWTIIMIPSHRNFSMFVLQGIIMILDAVV